jgi:diguanylate cyclase
MADEGEWKQRYEALLRQHEELEAADGAREKLLTQTVIRLTLAAGGLDEKLDPHLKAIRDSVRGGVSSALGERLKTLSDSLLHYSEEEAPAALDPAAAAARLLNQLALSQQALAEATPLLARLFSEPDGIGDQELSQLAGLLSQLSVSEQGKGGLLSRFLGGGGQAAGRSEPSPNNILMNLLEQASWPGHWGEAISRFKDRLLKTSSVDEWIPVLQDLLDLSARSYGEARTEVKEAEDFLSELTQRLQDLDTHLRQAQDGRHEVLEQSRKLSDEVSGHVEGMETMVHEAVDLQQLKLDVSRRLNGIQQTMARFLEGEQQWDRRAESNEAELRARLRQLEQESSDLRSRMLEAHHLALKDAVTGLPNRQAYEERVEQEFARWKRFGEPLTMLVWDVDNFKSINDRFGHQAGDKALRVIARSLRQRLRETDFIARYGGEEFVTLLCGADLNEALKVAEQMRLGVMETPFHSGGKEIPVTISCGISDFKRKDDAAIVFARADKALYKAKRGGKNRCEIG